MKNKYKIEGNTVVIYMNGQGKVHECLIDLDDFDKVNGFSGTWYAFWSPKNRTFYAIVNLKELPNGKRPYVRMHRLVMDTPEDMQTDHINHNTLDNRKSNLRNVTQAENMLNKQMYKNNTTGVSGVIWESKRSKWVAQVQIGRKHIFLGQFDTLEEAAEARKNFTDVPMPL